MSSRPKDLDLEVDDAFQKAEWGVQRTAWGVWALILAAGLAGLLGPGPLSKVKTTAADESLSVAYDRFLHYHHPTQIEVEVSSAVKGNGPLQIRLDRELLDRIQIRRIEPEPERAELGGDIVYSFSQSQPSSSGSIIFHVEFERFGISRGSVGIVGHEAVVVDQFVYP